MSETSPLPQLAADIAKWFPELEGRSLAVSEAQITATNIPTLPICMVALINGTGEHQWRAGNGEITFADDFMIDFWMPPERYKKEDNSETPFWSFFDYAAIRSKLMTNIVTWGPPYGVKIEYISISVEADSFAVMVSFKMRLHYRWCADVIPQDLCVPSTEIDGQPAKFITSICVPKNMYCDPCENCEQEPTCP